MTARPLHSFVYPLKKLPPPAGSEGAGGELPLIMVAAVARRDPERRSCTRCCDLPPRRLGRLADCWISRSGSQWKTLQSRIGGAGVPSKQSRWLGWGFGDVQNSEFQIDASQCELQSLSAGPNAWIGFPFPLCELNCIWLMPHWFCA